MNELNKLIQQYEQENPGKKVKDPFFSEWENEFVLWLASRPTCGKEQRLFLDELENCGYLDLGGNLRTHGLSINLENTLVEKSRFNADLQKVIKGM